MVQKIPKHIKQAFIPDHGELTTEEKQQLAQCVREMRKIEARPLRLVSHIADLLLACGEVYNS